jgi:predicted enzyme related to lactoylglutathione lyase
MPTIVHFDLPADDTERARKFYSEIFGWKFESYAGPMEYHLITTHSLDGSVGVGGGMGKRMSPDQRIMNYFGVPSIDAYLVKVREMGGKITMQKMPVPGMGYLATCIDTEGNPFGLWEENPAAR